MMLLIIISQFEKNIKLIYEYERERAYKEKQDQLNGKSVSTEHMTPFMYTSLSNHNNDHDNHNNNYNNNNHHDDYYNDDDNVND